MKIEELIEKYPNHKFVKLFMPPESPRYKVDSLDDVVENSDYTVVYELHDSMEDYSEEIIGQIIEMAFDEMSDEEYNDVISSKKLIKNVIENLYLDGAEEEIVNTLSKIDMYRVIVIDVTHDVGYFESIDYGFDAEVSIKIVRLAEKFIKAALEGENKAKQELTNEYHEWVRSFKADFDNASTQTAKSKLVDKIQFYANNLPQCDKFEEEDKSKNHITLLLEFSDEEWKEFCGE